MTPVEDLLNSKNITYRIQGRDFLIKCLNPEHEDSNPSMRVDKDTGIFNCFSCGFGGNIYSHFGVLSNNLNLKLTMLKSKLKKVREDQLGLDPIEGAVPYSTSFRGISAATLKLFKAQTTTEVASLDSRIIFPITDVSGKTVVYIARHVLSQANPRYLIYPKSTKVPLFPVKMPKGTKSIVLVEGIFDLLNCYDKGLKNVVCTFGTQTLKADIESKLLFFKAQGIYKVYLMFDGDNAGREAMQELKPQLEKQNFTVDIIKLKDGVDPGNLSQEDINEIIEYTKEK